MNVVWREAASGQRQHGGWFEGGVFLLGVVEVFSERSSSSSGSLQGRVEKETVSLIFRYYILTRTQCNSVSSDALNLYLWRNQAVQR